MAMTVTCTLVNVLDVAPNTEIVLTEDPPASGTWTADTMVEKTCHDCRLQYDVPIQVSYTPNFDSWTDDVATITMDGETEFGGTFGPESVGSLVSIEVENSEQMRVGKVEPPNGHGYLSNSTITFTATEMPALGIPNGDYELVVAGTANGTCSSCADLDDTYALPRIVLDPTWSTVPFDFACVGPNQQWIMVWDEVQNTLICSLQGGEPVYPGTQAGYQASTEGWNGEDDLEMTYFYSDHPDLCSWPATVTLRRPA